MADAVLHISLADASGDAEILRAVRGERRRTVLLISHQLSAAAACDRILVIEAGPRGSMRFRKAVGLERMDRRTRKWGPVPPEDLALGPETNTTYRLGGVWLRFG